MSNMFVIRNVFRCKPGQAKNVIDKFKAAMPIMSEIAKSRILVDQVASFWTVVIETETEDLSSFERLQQERGQRQEVQEAMSGYMDLVDSGYREIFRVVE
jgi:hypothetical protein